MKKTFSVGSLIPALLVLLSLTQVFAAPPGAHVISYKSILPKSPLSGGVLMAQAIHRGLVQGPHAGTTRTQGTPALACSPVPCALPNIQASKGGSSVNEDPIAISPNHQENLLTGGNDYNCTNIQGFYASHNGGLTWRHHCMGNLPGAYGAGDPGVGFDLNNTAYATGIDLETPDGSDIIFEKSTDNGKTWSAPAVAVAPLTPGGETDKDWLQIDTHSSSPFVNSLYVSVTQFDGGFSTDQISVSHSHDGGATWTTVAVDPPQSLSSSVDQFSDLAIAKNGAVYVSWLRCPPTGPTGDCGGTKSQMLVSRSTDGGNTWSAPVVMATVHLAPDTCNAYYGCLPNTNERVSDIPAIDTGSFGSQRREQDYATFYNWTGTYMQVLVTTSIDHGNTWSRPVPVAPKRATRDQFFPWLTVNSSGQVGVSWLDRRNDPGNISYEVFAAVSSDGGATFGTNIQVSSVPSNPFNDGFGGSFMGDYTGNTWNYNRKLYVSWMDTRSGVDAQDEVGGIQIL